MYENFLAGFMSTATHDINDVVYYVRALNDCKNEILSFLSALKCDSDGAAMFGQDLGSLANWETLGVFMADWTGRIWKTMRSSPSGTCWKILPLT
ncbi:hypothetical protein QP999_03075 [Corynebacterium sp. MSK004]|uniref:hypothetical protein n=1 Tax=Corynebacterium sp. MSK004 TaxID=3050186 RepID=UPI00254A3E03|nr:hypothetical protein [Corynebacterium sp. MSK004]MDK8896925.1 hypothetical protein [Corynebacterium sp. MSK004]